MNGDYAFEPRDGGALAVRVAGVWTEMRPSGALWIAEERCLVAADLHLEKGSSYARRGQMLPPYDTRDTLDRLTAEVERLEPATLVLLGDSFHDAYACGRIAAADAQRLFALADALDFVWIRGNHDADGIGGLAGLHAVEWRIGPLTLRHSPQPGPAAGEIAGHLHPAARVRASRGVVRRRCFITDAERLVLPAFGAYAGSLNVRDAAFEGLFARPPIAAALGAQRVHAVGWRSLVDG